MGMDSEALTCDGFWIVSCKSKAPPYLFDKPTTKDRLMNETLRRYRSDVPTRLNELKLLKDGWLDGGGQALDGMLLDRLGLFFATCYPREFPLPYTFPTESGGVQFEWRIHDAIMEIDIDLASMKGKWLSNIPDEATIDLSSSRGWAYLVNRISKIRENEHLYSMVDRMLEQIESFREAIKANLYTSQAVNVTETTWIETVVTEDERTDDPVLYAIRQEGKVDPIDYSSDIWEAFDKAKQIGGKV